MVVARTNVGLRRVKLFRSVFASCSADPSTARGKLQRRVDLNFELRRSKRANGSSVQCTGRGETVRIGSVVPRGGLLFNITSLGTELAAKTVVAGLEVSFGGRRNSTSRDLASEGKTERIYDRGFGGGEGWGEDACARYVG